MNEHIEFFRAFVRSPKKVGSVAPSSIELSKRMLEGIIPSKDSVLVELGPGTGSFTKFINAELKYPDSYLGIEIDGSLVSRLHTKFPHLKFVKANACGAFEVHRKLGLGKVEYIISGLPFVSLSIDETTRVLDEIDKFMSNGCLFRTFQYAHGYFLPPAVKFRDILNVRYGTCTKSPLIVKNVPPAFTFTWDTRTQ